MPDLSPTIDGSLIKVGSTWANTTGDGVDATNVFTSEQFDNNGINAIDLSAYSTTQVERCIFEFNTEDIVTTPASATFKVFGKSSGTAGVRGVKCTLASAGAIVVGDWDSWNESAPVNYTDKIDAGYWSTSTYNTFTLTPKALADMVSLNRFQIMLLEADNDYDQSSAGSGLNISAGLYFQDDTSAGRRPVLSYVEGEGPILPTKLKVNSGTINLNGGVVNINS